MKKKSMREREKKRETVERKKKHSNMERVGEKNIETERE